MKVLVVDDDRVLADLVVFTLRRAGNEAIIAMNPILVKEIRTDYEDEDN